jgi:hypothetical protein
MRAYPQKTIRTPRRRFLHPGTHVLSLVHVRSLRRVLYILTLLLLCILSICNANVANAISQDDVTSILNNTPFYDPDASTTSSACATSTTNTTSAGTGPAVVVTRLLRKMPLPLTSFSSQTAIPIPNQPVLSVTLCTSRLVLILRWSRKAAEAGTA